jgi:hypothetical protein
VISHYRDTANSNQRTGSEDLKAWVAQGLAELSRESTALRLTAGAGPDRREHHVVPVRFVDRRLGSLFAR